MKIPNINSLKKKIRNLNNSLKIKIFPNSKGMNRFPNKKKITLLLHTSHGDQKNGKYRHRSINSFNLKHRKTFVEINCLLCTNIPMENATLVLVLEYNLKNSLNAIIRGNIWGLKNLSLGPYYF